MNPHPSEGGRHLVKAYENDADLAGVAGAFIAAGLREAEPVLVISTPGHWESFAPVIEESGVNLRSCESDGRILRLDAEAALGQFMERDAPDPGRFREIIGGAVARALGTGRSPKVRAYEEMVDLLWQAGRLSTALRLEHLWGELLRSHPLTLLCAYRANYFDGRQIGALEAIARAHSHSIFSEDPERLDRAVDRAFAEVIGGSRGEALRALIGSTLHPSRPLGKADGIVFWMCRNLPSHAEAVLGLAHKYFYQAP
jgi:DcmR-like sensory protein